MEGEFEGRGTGKVVDWGELVTVDMKDVVSVRSATQARGQPNRPEGV